VQTQLRTVHACVRACVTHAVAVCRVERGREASGVVEWCGAVWCGVVWCEQVQCKCKSQSERGRAEQG
jgi:hypothetical protein